MVVMTKHKSKSATETSALPDPVAHRAQRVVMMPEKHPERGLKIHKIWKLHPPLPADDQHDAVQPMS
jgi:hypothetical protein